MRKIRSGQPLSDAHFQSFLYQTLCGLKVSSPALIASLHPSRGMEDVVDNDNDWTS